MKKILIAALTVLLSGTVELAEAQQKVDNPVVESIMARRSVRKYKDQPVEKEKLELLAECGINAPSAINKQPWQLRIVTDSAFINGTTREYVKANPKQAEDPGFKNMYRNAPVIIIVASPDNGSGQPDCGMLAQNIMIAAQSMGLGSVCLGAPTRFLSSDPSVESYLKQLDLPEGYTPLLTIGVGYPDETPAAKPRDPSKVKFIE